MNNSLQILLIDDHPLILDSYKRSFKYCSKETNTKHVFLEASNCDQAAQVIQESFKLQKSIDVAIIDVRIPPDSSKQYVSGEDIAMLLKELYANTKIIISTSIDNSYRIHNIIKSVNPDGLLIKGDLTPKELVTAISAVIQGDTYFSKTVINFFRKTTAANVLIDPIDRKLLYELSIGARMKDLPSILNLSKPAIEKRKRNLKIVFDVNSNDDKELIDAAKANGFV